MGDPYIGEIRLLAFNFAPRGWATCDGQTMPITQNQALYSLLNTIYGGDGRTTFNLPDLRGRTMIHRSQTYPEGVKGGTETVALTAASQLPVHSHGLLASSAAGSTNAPGGNLLAAVADATNSKYAYATEKASPAAFLAPASLAPAGASAGHNNMQPSLVVNYCIALTGVYPPRDW